MGGTSTSASTPAAAATTTRPTSTATTTTSRRPAQTTGRPAPVVVLDPGHNGRNADNPWIINALVPAGGGATKACNTTGTETADGYAEHAFNWSVATQVKAVLEQSGVRVVMTRVDDDGVGPCVDRRAGIGNDAHADAVVSIHGDGGVTGHGFHIIRSPQQLGGSSIAADGMRLAADVHARMLSGTGLTTATYVHDGTGYDLRTDLAGLNLSTRPSILVECGNMRDAGDAAIMTNSAGRSRIATALAAGILTFVGR